MLVAQAARTEVSPAAAKAAASATPGAAGAEQPIIPGIGTRSFKITTGSKVAQQYFDQGLRLAWNFNHAEARRAFQKAQRARPAMRHVLSGARPMSSARTSTCRWIRRRMRRPRRPPRRRTSLAANTCARERALIDALAARYSEDPAPRAADAA